MEVINQKQTRVSLELPESLIKVIDERANTWNLKRGSYLKFLVMSAANEFSQPILLDDFRASLSDLNSI